MKWSTYGFESATVGVDFVEVPLTTLTFAANETAKTVTVNSDTVDEDNERFSVRLSSPTGAIIADGLGGAMIVDDDPTTALVVNDVLSINESVAGVTKAEFTISRSGDTSGASSVVWSTADGTATAGGDYVAVGPTTVNFAAGETTKRASVTIVSSSTGATIVDGSGTARIVDGD